MGRNKINFFVFFTAVFVFLSCAVTAGVVKDVAIRKLDHLSPNTIGTHTGPIGLWANSDPDDLKDLFHKISEIEWTPGERNILVHLLLTDTTEDVWPISDQPDDTTFLTARVEALFHMGAFRAVSELVRYVPEKYKNSTITLYDFYARFFVGDVESACRDIENRPMEQADKIQLICLNTLKDKSRAVLAYDLYRENTSDDDALFTALADTLFQERPFKAPLEITLKPYHLPFIASLNDKDGLLRRSNAPWVTAFTAYSSKLPIIMRVQALEKMGGNPADFEKLYLALAKEKETGRVFERAVAVQRMKNAPTSAELGKALKEFVDLARQDGIFPQTTLFLADMIRSVKPTAENNSLVDYAVDIYFGANELAFVYDWYRVLPKDSFDALEKAPIVHASGMGLPMMDQLFDLCQAHEKRCHRLVERLTPYFVIKNIENYTSLKPLSVLAYPPVVVSQIRHLKDTMKEGEALIKGMMLLHASPLFEGELLRLIQSMLPKGASVMLERERMLR